MSIKLFTKLFSFVVLLTLFSLNLRGQFFADEFDGGLPSDWSVVNVTGDGTATSDWFYTATGPAGGFATDPIASNSAANGWMIFDSDLNCAAGGSQESWLISPANDGTGRPSIFLSFSTYYRRFNDQALVRVGTDLNDMANWATFDPFPNATNNTWGDGGDGSVNPQFIALDISSAAVGQAQFYFAFQFKSDASTIIAGDLTGCAYSWQIDDVELTEGDPTPANDIKIDSANVRIDYATPVSQIDTVRFVQSLVNEGLNDQTNIEIKVEVQGDNGESFTAVDTLDMLAAGSAVAIQLDTFFIPTQVGTYTVTHTVTQAEMDERPTTNTTENTFLITADLFAKDDGRIVNSVQPGTITGDTWQMGNLFFIPNEGYRAVSADFAISTSDESLMDKQVTILLYRVADDAPTNFDDSHLEAVGFNTFTFTDEEEFDLVSAEILDASTGMPGVMLDGDGAAYILAIQLQADMFLAYSDIPYYYDFASVLFDGAAWFAGGFGPETTAQVRMRIESIVSDVEDTPLADGSIKLFPNPTTGLINVDLALENVSEQVNVRIMDNTGRMLLERNYENLSTEQLSYDLSQYPSGAYFMHVRTDDGVKTERFILQR